MLLEKIVLEYLTSVLDAPCFMEVPEEMPVFFIVLEKTSDSEENRIHRATMAAQSYADTLEHAAELDERVRGAMESIATLDTISKCTLNSSYEFTDTALKRYRYQSVFDIVF